MKAGDHIQVWWGGELIEAIFIKINQHGVLEWRYEYENEEDLEL